MSSPQYQSSSKNLHYSSQKEMSQTMSTKGNSRLAVEMKSVANRENMLNEEERRIAQLKNSLKKKEKKTKEQLRRIKEDRLYK
jgi:hypothetical protein